MDYSGVTTWALRSRLSDLVEREIKLGWEQTRVAKEVDEIRGELVLRWAGTTDDRVEWQEVGLR